MKQRAIIASIDRLRLIGKLEGLSFLALLGVGMPLKYMKEIPEPVTYIGWAHGVLFVLFCFALLHTLMVTKWSVMRGMFLFVAALIPFGPFLVDRRLVKERDEIGS